MVEIFQVIGSFGIKGGLKIRSYTDDLSFYQKVYDEFQNEYDLSVKKHGTSEVVFLSGINDRNASDTLRGKIFYVSRNELKKLEENQFYIHDLIGQTVSVQDTAKTCKIISFQNYGAGDLIELSFEGDTYLVPFTKQNFPESDNEIIITEDAFRGFIENVAG